MLSSKVATEAAETEDNKMVENILELSWNHYFIQI